MSIFGRIPLAEILKGIPGIFGVRLDEQPRYTAVETAGQVEVRRYAPLLLARVTFPGEFDVAVDRGFDRLASYIFGANDRAMKLAMTSPVEQHPHRGADGPVLAQEGSEGWTLTFFLSNEMTLAEAPTPKDASIELVRAPERTVAALQYRGNNTAQRRDDSRRALLTALADHPRWQVDGAVYWAQYDAPFTLPFLKKNEAMVELRPRRSEP